MVEGRDMNGIVGKVSHIGGRVRAQPKTLGKKLLVVETGNICYYILTECDSRDPCLMPIRL
jgi:hypothetical protein